MALPVWFSFLSLLCPVLLCLAFLCPLLSADVNGLTRKPDPTIEITGTTMGPIVFNVTVVQHDDGAEGVTRELLEPRVNETLERVNSLLSSYLDDSDVSRFNRSESTDWFDVDPETAAVVARAIEISELTGGAFDVTVSPAVALWNFGAGSDSGEQQLPSSSNVDAVRELIGYEKLSVRLDPPALKKEMAGVQIDLSAIAKGYAVDAVVETLRDNGCTNFLVEVGGEAYANGLAPSGNRWQLGIERPVTNGRTADGSPQLSDIAELNNQALATSGDYRNFHLIDGRAYSHTIDPTTARPVVHMTASASIVAVDCMTADAMATALMVTGAARRAALCEETSMASLVFVRSDPDPRIDQSFERFVSADFPFNKEFHTEQNAVQFANKRGIMPVFLAALIVFSLAILGMAVGSIVANKPVKGSCGGLSAMTGEDGESSCTLCSEPVTECVERDEQVV